MTLETVIQPLNRIFRLARTRYAVIGAYAVAAWGSVRATQDLDIYCEWDRTAAVVEQLREARWEVEERRGDQDDPVRLVLRAHSPEDAEVDILSGIRGAPAGIVARAREISISALMVPVASPEDMILLKLLAGSALDLQDAREIIAIQGNQLSRDTLVEICPRPLRARLDRFLKEPT